MRRRPLSLLPDTKGGTASKSDTRNTSQWDQDPAAHGNGRANLVEFFGKSWLILTPLTLSMSRRNKGSRRIVDTPDHAED